MAKYKQKTKETDASVVEFIESVDNPKKRQDAYTLLQIFEETTGCEAKMWGPLKQSFDYRVWFLPL